MFYQVKDKNTANTFKNVLNDGNIMVGSKISSSDQQIILDTEMGIFKIKKEDYFLCLPSIRSDIFLPLSLFLFLLVIK